MVELVWLTVIVIVFISEMVAGWNEVCSGYWVEACSRVLLRFWE